MFTGLIQQIGKLGGKETAAGSRRLIIHSQKWDPPLMEGESIAVNGVCLTVAQVTGQEFVCDVLEETIRCSNLNAKQIGAFLNLERALKVGDPLGGHLITGHVEGTGKLIKRKAEGRDWTLEIAGDSTLLRYIVPKGSIACDGVSLTVASLADNSFSVKIIPFTWQNTNLHQLREGDTLNLETDLIGKYVFRRLEQEHAESPITLDLLRRAGFLDI